jgi:hypothetical protein
MVQFRFPSFISNERANSYSMKDDELEELEPYASSRSSIELLCRESSSTCLASKLHRLLDYPLMQ